MRTTLCRRAFYVVSEDPEMVSSHDDIGGISDVEERADTALPSAGLSFRISEEHHQTGNADEDTRIDKNGAACGHGGDGTGYAEDEENIEDAGADHVTHGNAGVALFCGDDGGDELGQRGSDRNDGKTDERFTHAERGGDRFRAVNNELSAADDGCGAENDENNALGPREDLRFFFFSVFRAALQSGSDEHEHIGCKEDEKNGD